MDFWYFDSSLCLVFLMMKLGLGRAQGEFDLSFSSLVKT